MGGQDLVAGVKVRLPTPGGGYARRLPPDGLGEPWTRRRIVRAGVVSLAAWILLQWVSPPAPIRWSRAMTDAAETMARGLELTADHCRGAGIPVDPELDPNATCLVGPRDTPLFTTLGQVEAKRSTLSPDMAGLLVHLLEAAGVAAGDTVAIGASGSFPGLLLATLAAVQAMGAEPVAILSLGSSSFGATRPEFHLLDLYQLLRAGGVVAEPPAAVSPGGEEDAGTEFGPGVGEALRRAATEAGVRFLEEEGLEANVDRRMAIYGNPAVFVNIGGAEANLGVSPMVLEVPAGLVPPSLPLPPLPPSSQRGVLLEMVARGVPVVHLLHIRGLALRYGMPWDPIPLPGPGSTHLREGDRAPGWRFWLLTAAYLGALVGLALPRRPGLSPLPPPRLSSGPVRQEPS